MDFVSLLVVVDLVLLIVVSLSEVLVVDLSHMSVCRAAVVSHLV